MSSSLLHNRVLVLAGGLGTRLRSVVSDRPKVLAPVHDRTFLDCLVEQLYAQGLRRVVLLLGYRHEQVEVHVQTVLVSRFPDMEFAVSVEEVPLGTAGALGLARAFCDDTFLLLNGDTYVEFDARALMDAHIRTGALMTLAVRRVKDGGRYGSLNVDEEGRISAFFEKAPSHAPGLINAGVYLMEPRVLADIPAGMAFSLEHDVMPMLLAREERLQALEVRGHFFDIGTPSSHAAFTRFVAASAGRRDGGKSLIGGTS